MAEPVYHLKIEFIDRLEITMSGFQKIKEERERQTDRQTDRESNIK